MSPPPRRGGGQGGGAEGVGAYLPAGQIATQGDTSPPHTKKLQYIRLGNLHKWIPVTPSGTSPRSWADRFMETF